jgi:hypothetical protein
VPVLQASQVTDDDRTEDHLLIDGRRMIFWVKNAGSRKAWQFIQKSLWPCRTSGKSGAKSKSGTKIKPKKSIGTRHLFIRRIVIGSLHLIYTTKTLQFLPHR